jgi:hypothetical protein
MKEATMPALTDVDQPKRAHPPSEAEMAGRIEDAAILLGMACGAAIIVVVLLLLLAF